MSRRAVRAALHDTRLAPGQTGVPHYGIRGNEIRTQFALAESPLHLRCFNTDAPQSLVKSQWRSWRRSTFEACYLSKIKDRQENRSIRQRLHGSFTSCISSFVYALIHMLDRDWRRLRLNGGSYRLSALNGPRLLGLPLVLGNTELEEGRKGLGEVLEEALLVLGVLLDNGLKLGVGAGRELSS